MQRGEAGQKAPEMLPEEWMELTLVVDAADALLALNVPHPDSLIMRARQQQHTIHGHRQACH